MTKQERLLQLLMWLEDVGSEGASQFLHMLSDQKFGDEHWTDYRETVGDHFLIWGEDLMDHWVYPPTCKYHTFDHCLRVATRALKFWGDDVSPTTTLQIAPDCCVEPLIVAALWHDSGYDPLYGDNVNVPAALDRFMAAYQKVGGMDPGLAHRVCDLIASTYYPYDQNHVFSHKDHHMSILRDADLLEVSDPRAVTIIDSLYQELKENGKFTGDRLDWVAAQTKFLTEFAPYHISQARQALLSAASARWRDAIDPNWRLQNV